MEQRIINSSKLVVADLVQLASFGKPQSADDSVQDKDGIIRRKKGNKVIGLTVLNASLFEK